MSKIICEVCGTSYPETSAQCPICGSARPVETAGIEAETGTEQPRSYTYVKGGRFSKANVRKRNRSNQSAESRPQAVVAATQRNSRTTKKKNNTGLVITAILLLLAIAAIVIYLMLRFFWPPLPEINTDPVPQVTDQPTEAEPVATNVPCQSIEVDVGSFILTEKGSARMIYATVSPLDVTDPVLFTSSDETVATVNENGKVEAVGPGKATITVSCGDKSVTCTVQCDFEEETSESTEDTTEETTAAAVDFRLNRSDITMLYQGEKWMLYSGDLDVTQITWTTNNQQVATIENGTVVAVGEGTTTVYGEYNGVKVSCIIRCSFSSSGQQGTGGHGGVTEDG